jgi:hypothetical protein
MISMNMSVSVMSTEMILNLLQYNSSMKASFTFKESTFSVETICSDFNFPQMFLEYAYHLPFILSVI